MAKEPRQADFGPEADAAARADAGAAPAPSAPASGGVEVELLSDYWPAEQPEPEMDPKKKSNEVRLRAGERVSLPQEEVMRLLERGIAKRVQQ